MESPIPNLAGVITKADVSTKGTGSYAADYVNWAKVVQLLMVHAPGYQFHLRRPAHDQHVWSAPDGTGYVVGYFKGPDGHETPDFPQAVMNNRNQAVKLEAISARDLTDTHRRCLCTAACFTFCLAYELWSKEGIEDPHRQDASPAPAPAPSKPAPAASKAPPASKPPKNIEWIDPEVHAEVIAKLKAASSERKESVLAAFKKEFSIATPKVLPSQIQLPKHGTFLLGLLTDEQS